MLTFETINELTLKVTCTGNDVLFTKAGAFIAGENAGGKNYRFEKVLFGPQMLYLCNSLNEERRVMSEEFNTRGARHSKFGVAVNFSINNLKERNRL